MGRERERAGEGVEGQETELEGMRWDKERCTKKKNMKRKTVSKQNNVRLHKTKDRKEPKKIKLV